MKNTKNKQEEEKQTEQQTGQMELTPVEQTDSVPEKLEKAAYLTRSFNTTRKALAKNLAPAEIKTNDKVKVKRNGEWKPLEYLMISDIEDKLDMTFSGLWQTENFQWQMLTNEITGSITLKVYFPGIGWISRIGSGSVPIQTAEGSDITDFTKKIKNALVKGMPALKAECFKNACKSLGRFFGRDLNRDAENNYEIYISDSEVLESAKEKVKSLMNADNVNTIGLEIVKEYELQLNDIEKKKLQDFIRDSKIKIKEGKN